MTRNTGYSFKNLELWKAAQDFAIEILTLADALPQRRSADIIARQLIRSSTSISANIAEGHGRFTIPAYRNHLSIAKGSASETQTWLDMLVRLQLIPPDDGARLDRQCTVLIAALTRRIRSLEDQARRSRLSEDGPVYDAGLVPGFEGSKVQDDDEEAAR